MRKFFHGWRRKAGVVALMVALVVGGVWVRSYAMFDMVSFPFAERQQSIYTMEGTLYWWGHHLDPGWGYESTQIPSVMVRTTIENARRMLVEINEANFREWIIPLWVIVIPLTLLSAYLIVWKPRKRVPATPTN